MAKEMFQPAVRLAGPPIKDAYLAGFREMVDALVNVERKKPAYLRALEEKIISTIQNERAIQAENRYLMMEDEDWFDGQNYRDDTLAESVPELASLTHNIIRHPVEYILATAKTLKMEGSVIPLGGSQYSESQLNSIVKAYDDRLKIAQEQGGFRMAKDKAIDDAAVAGVGYWETVLRYHRETNSYYIDYRHLPWRNVYKDSGVQGTTDARHFYHVEWVDMFSLINRYPDSEVDIRQMAQEFSNLVQIDRGYEHLNHYQYGWNNTYYGGQGRPSYSEHTRPMAVFGTGYIKDDLVDERGAPLTVTLRVHFIMDEGFSKVKLLTEPKWLYGHNQIPVTEMAFAYRKADNQPFSPPIRNLIGMQKTVRILLRHAILNLSGRGAIVDVQALPDGLDPDRYVEDIEQRLVQSIYVLPRYGEKTVEVLESDRRHDQLFNALAFCINAAKENSGVHPQLVGDKTGVDAAIAMKRLADDAMRTQHRFFTHLTDAVKHSAELSLSLIEQFHGRIEYPSRPEGGRIIRATADGEHTIKGNRAMYHIVPITREETIGDAHLMLFSELIKVYPQIGPSLLPMIIKAMRIGDTEHLAEDIKDILQSMGVPIPKSTLTPEERQAQDEQAQAQAQAQAAMQDAELKKVQSEASKNQAAAMKSAAEAERPNESTELAEYRATVARLEDELAAIKGGA